MGFSASQARYLALTARMNDIEFQGQQINQQRTTLSNQINDMYASLLDMSVPTPPSVQAYTEIVYDLNVGATHYQLGSIRPNGDYLYSINLTYEEVGHYLERSPSTTHVVLQDDTYYVGNIESGIELSTFASQVGDNNPIPEDRAHEYCEGIRNYFPEFAELSDDDVMDKFMLYFTSEGTAQIPHFIRIDNLINNVANHGGSGYIQEYTYISNGTYPAVRHEDNCTLTFDAQGLISELGLPNYDPNSGALIGHTTYRLTSHEETNQAAYDRAFQEYEHEKYEYDRKQTALNAKTSVIQAQDKNLELKLTRLDNERNAVNTEMEAVKKVIQDNIEKSFKTFSG